MNNKGGVAILSRIVTVYPWWTLLLTLSMVLVMAVGMKNLDFKNNYRIYFGKENPQLLAFEAIQNTYNKTDNVMFVIEPADGTVFTNRTLQTIHDLTKKAWKIAYSNRVDSLTNFQNTKANGDELKVADLVSYPRLLNDADRQYIRQIALNEPLLVNRLVSKTGHVAGVSVNVQLPGKDASETTEVALQARQLAAETEYQNPGIKVYLTGGVMMDNALVEGAMQDIETLVPVMYAIIVLGLMLCLRSVTGTLVTVFLLVFSSVAALGTAGWLGWDLNPTSAMSPVIITTMAVADCVHLIITLIHNLRLGDEKKLALYESLRVNFQPVFLTSLTTAVGFMSMNFSDAPPFRELGNIVAIGVVVAWVLAITFLPAFLSVLPIRVKIQEDLNNTHMQRLAEFVIHNRKMLLIGNLLLTIFATSFVPRNQLNDEFVKYFDKTVEFRQGSDFLNENMGGIYTIEYSIHAGSPGGVSEPKFMQKIERLTKWLEQQPEVVHVNSIIDTFKRLNKNLHDDDHGWYKLPGRRDLSAQYLLLYEMSLPYGLDLNDQINVDKSSIRLIAYMKSMSSNNMLAVESRANNWLQSQLPELKVEVASPILMFSHIGKRNIQSMLLGTLLALVLISFMLIFAFRSIKLGLVSMIPNLAPAAIAFGFWGLIDGQIGLGLSVVSGMTLGIVVDDTIHFISKYQRAVNEKGLDSHDAVRYVFSTVGVAMWVTSAVLVSGFLVLSLSHFVMNAEIGFMTALTIAIALLMDLLLLPPLLLGLSASTVDDKVKRFTLKKI